MIAVPYLLVLNIALVEAEGAYWCEPLWAKDLLLHLDGIERLHLFCPIERRVPPAGWLRLDDPRLMIMPAPAMGRFAWAAIPAIAWRLRRAIGTATIVHTGVAGWPFPLGWLAVPLAHARGKLIVIVVESSFWRIPAGTRAAPWRRMRAALWEAINRGCIGRADLAIFTTEAYRDSLAAPDRPGTQVAPASWIDAEQVLDAAAFDRTSGAKQGRLLFAGRLTAEKGVEVLLDAVARSGARLDIIGEGPLAAGAADLAARHPDRVRLLAPVAYGPAFFDLLDGYDALVVPTLSEEQPRIVLDGFARGLPAIASDTSGHRGLVRHGDTGWLVPVGDADALAAALDRAGSERTDVAAMGRRALAVARGMTHAAMHRDRISMIEAALARRAGVAPAASLA